MLHYPITLTPDSNGTFLIGFPDFPEANSVGEDEQDAVRNAADALASLLEVYFEEQRPIPLPSPAQNGQLVVALPELDAAKVLAWNDEHVRSLR